MFTQSCYLEHNDDTEIMPNVTTSRHFPVPCNAYSGGKEISDVTSLFAAGSFAGQRMMSMACQGCSSYRASCRKALPPLA